jgi:hypothetical protein
LLARFRPFFFYAGLFSFFINLLLLVPGLYMLQRAKSARHLQDGPGKAQIRAVRRRYAENVKLGAKWRSDARPVLVRRLCFSRLYWSGS